MVLKSEVARIFLEVFSLWLFSRLTLVLEKHIQYKICNSDIPLSKSKKLIGLQVGNMAQ